MDKFSFDEWSRLYEIDPIAFENKRKEVIEAEILKAPIDQRAGLRLLQMHCDALHNSLSPLGATIEISKLMTQKLGELIPPLTQLKLICDDSSQIDEK